MHAFGTRPASAQPAEPLRARRPQAEPALRRGRWADIAPVFNLIQLGSQAGHFSPLYLQPRYCAGLALQLMAVCVLGRIPLPGGGWHHARLMVASDGRSLAGFTLLVDLPGGDGQEIYMCAVQPGRQGQGHGRAMLQAVLGQVPASQRLQADCLPASRAMARLLRSEGFIPVTGPPRSALAPVRLERVSRPPAKPRTPSRG